MPAITEEVLCRETYIRMPEKQRTIYMAVKRVFDFFASICGLILALPIMLVIAIAIKCTDGGPVIHARICQGKNGNTYKMYKFRSMVVDADNLKRWLTPKQLETYMAECKLDNDPRITRVGRFIRRTSLDELPQLVSVLKGDMSLIGPRPVVDHEADHYGAKKELLLSVKPGITGYWQVNGRSGVPFLSEEAKNLQLYYVEHCSLALDIKILFKTVSVVLKGKGAK